MAEEHTTELLERLHEAEKTILKLKIEAHSNRAELQEVKASADAERAAHSNAIKTAQDDLAGEKARVANYQTMIEGIKDHQLEGLVIGVAELKEMLTTALDLKTTPKPELFMTVTEESEEVAPYDRFSHADYSRPPTPERSFQGHETKRQRGGTWKAYGRGQM
ncbi:hypothetical protein LTR15_000359 [Elasticomyces elasticus]|nr:hypothetical protein LTR15_000359 [Elasticomyces elasticus]